MIVDLIEEFIFHLLISGIIFIIPLIHRSRFILRFIVATTLYFIFSIAIDYIVVEIFDGVSNRIYGYSFIALVLVMLFVYIILLCNISFWDALVVLANAYATQNLIYDLSKIIDAKENQPLKITFTIILQLGIYIIFYFLISKRASDGGKYDAPWTEAVLYFAVVVSVTLILSSITAYYETPLEMAQAFKIMRFYGAACCFFILIWNTTMQRRYSVQRKLDNQTMLWEQQNKQLNFSRGSIELINTKLHDLKHQLEKAENTDDPEIVRTSIHNAKELITLYNSTQNTGNAILDTILTEISMRCERNRINWSCIADGKGFESLENTDLYSIIHGLLDIAISLSEKVATSERRVLSVTTFVKKRLTIFQCESYYETLIDQKDELQYIQNIIEKYDGSLSVDTSNNIFMCTVVVPNNQKM